MHNGIKMWKAEVLDMSSYNDYGWTDGNATKSHAFLYPSLLKRIKENVNGCILDLGCGNGVAANQLIGEGYDVYGVDASVKGVDIANKVNKDHFFVMDFEDDIIPDEVSNLKIDTIISLEVIEHLYSPQKYIQLVNKLLPVGGKLIISTPYNGWLKNVVLSFTGKMDQHWTTLWEGGHIKFWSRKTLTSILESNGFVVHSFTGCGRIPYLWKSMMLCAEKVK